MVHLCELRPSEAAQVAPSPPAAPPLRTTEAERREGQEQEVQHGLAQPRLRVNWSGSGSGFG